MRNFVFDLDGTIVSKGQPITNDIAAMLQALKQSNRVIFASARPIRDMLPLLHKNLHDCLMVGCNGGMAWQNGEFIFAHQFEQDTIDKILDFLNQSQTPYILDGHWDYGISDTHHDFHDYMAALSNQQTDVATLLHDGITKILILDGSSRETVNDFLKKEALTLNIHYHKSDDMYDITPQKENKYLALKALNTNFSHTIAFGNDANDFAMLDNAKIAVFLGDKNDYKNADFYCQTDELPTFIEGLVT